MNADRPNRVTQIPGPRSRELLQSLEHRESRNVTAISDDFPVVWERAENAMVEDADGNRFVDLTAAFGVANVGHAEFRMSCAPLRDQAARLPHAMGDVHPASARIALLERLSEIVPAALQRTFLASTGSEAIEAAMKTAVLATGRSTFAAFRGAYHGLSMGALALCGIEKFSRTVCRCAVFVGYRMARLSERRPRCLEPMRLRRLPRN